MKMDSLVQGSEGRSTVKMRKNNRKTKLVDYSNDRAVIETPRDSHTQKVMPSSDKVNGEDSMIGQPMKRSGFNNTYNTENCGDLVDLLAYGDQMIQFSIRKKNNNDSDDDDDYNGECTNYPRYLPVYANQKQGSVFRMKKRGMKKRAKKTKRSSDLSDDSSGWLEEYDGGYDILSPAYITKRLSSKNASRKELEALHKLGNLFSSFSDTEDRSSSYDGSERWHWNVDEMNDADTELLK